MGFISEYTNSRDNNFNLLRFVAALLVLYSHSFVLVTGLASTEPLRSKIGISLGDIAVDIFFVTSGFLITRSYFSKPNIAMFVRARILRIYPALVVAVIFCVLVGLVFTTLDMAVYLLDSQTHKFIFKNIVLLFRVEYFLPNVFLDNPLKNTINGSLWTLPYEVYMYILLAIVLSFITYIKKWTSYIRFKNTLLLIGLFSVILHIVDHYTLMLPAHIARLFSMFFMGAMFYVWRDKILLSSRWALYIVLALLLASMINIEAYFIVYYLFLPYLIFYIAYVPTGYMRQFNKAGDYSYGIYIYAFPVQQSLAATISGITVPMMIGYSFVVTLILSMLSWHLVEKKFLKMK